MEVSGQLHANPLYTWGKNLRYPLDRSWVGPRAGLDAVAKVHREISGPKMDEVNEIGH
jgi:hypothetical protein